MSESELIFRKLLWLHHGHSMLYGDDGEMQCPECSIDFKRDPAEHILETFQTRALRRIYGEGR